MNFPETVIGVLLLLLVLVSPWSAAQEPPGAKPMRAGIIGGRSRD